MRNFFHVKNVHEKAGQKMWYKALFAGIIGIVHIHLLSSARYWDIIEVNVETLLREKKKYFSFPNLIWIILNCIIESHRSNQILFVNWRLII